jgi:signal transduction histidine kinase
MTPEHEITDALAADVAAIASIDLVPKILEVVCRITGMGFAAVARVTEDRWVACAVRDEIAFGLTPGGELRIATTICNEIRNSGTAVVIDHVAEDELFRDHPTPELYGFQSYISTPIHHRGAFFGTLCAIDPKPADLKGPQTLATFELFAALIGSHLDTQQRLAESEAALIGEREAAELREQFIAVLGHDLRNPLAAIDGATRLLKKEPPRETAHTILSQMQSSVSRMTGLINDVMDFARGRLGGGLEADLQPDAPVEAALELVVAEFRNAEPGRRIESDIALTQSVTCDSRRVAQLVSNLVANAITHGAPHTPVRVQAHTTTNTFEVSVANDGIPIESGMTERLFRPFARASHRRNQQGLGLGLYIASEIARAHGGGLNVASEHGETRFTFTMPLHPRDGPVETT